MFGGKTPTGPNEYSANLLDIIDTEETSAPQNAQATLTEAAISVSNALHELVAVERAVHPKAKMPNPLDAARVGMAEKASVDWSGPVEPLLRKVATASHYNLRVLGRAPAIPILVSVAAKNTPLANILRDISFQADKQANIVLYPTRRIIELRYAGA